MNEQEMADWMSERKLTISRGHWRPRVGACVQAVRKAIPLNSDLDDRARYDRIHSWIQRAASEQPEELLEGFLARVIKLAVLASGPGKKHPLAWFENTLKNECGYPG